MQLPFISSVAMQLWCVPTKMIAETRFQLSRETAHWTIVFCLETIFHGRAYQSELVDNDPSLLIEYDVFSAFLSCMLVERQSGYVQNSMASIIARSARAEFIDKFGDQKPSHWVLLRELNNQEEQQVITRSSLNVSLMCYYLWTGPILSQLTWLHSESRDCLQPLCMSFLIFGFQSCDKNHPSPFQGENKKPAKA